MCINFIYVQNPLTIFICLIILMSIIIHIFVPNLLSNFYYYNYYIPNLYLLILKFQQNEN